MNVLMVEPGMVPRSVVLEDGVAAMQEAVGGSIEAVYPFEEAVALICNEEGKLMGLPFNRVLRHPETGEIYDIIAGTFVLCAAPPESEDFESLTEDQMGRYMELYRTPEFFFGQASW